MDKMDKMDKKNIYSRVVDGMTEKMASVLRWLVLVVMLLLVFEVFSRRVFGRPTEWNFFYTKQVFGVYFMLMVAYGVLMKSNIKVDLLYAKFTPKTRAWIDLFAHGVLLVPVGLIIVVFAYQYSLRSFVDRELYPTAMPIAVWPLKMLFPLSFVLLTLQGVSEAVKGIIFLRGGKK